MMIKLNCYSSLSQPRCNVKAPEACEPGRYGDDSLTKNKCCIVFNVCRYCALGGKTQKNLESLSCLYSSALALFTFMDKI